MPSPHAHTARSRVRVLHTSQEIREEIQRIFSKASGRRVAIVAFIGSGAHAHLPKPQGLEVHCWPLPGSTRVAGIEALQRRGAKVFFADRVHMKVYWSERTGAVIASANLSDNAFGIGDLREAGVAVPSRDVDIERLLKLIKSKEADSAALADLRRRETAWQLSDTPSAKVSIPTFAAWYDGTGGAPWKWDYYDSFGGGVSRRAKEAVKQIDPSYVPHDYVYCKRGKLKEADWVLRVRLTTDGTLISPQWLYVERVVLVEKRDRTYLAEFPFQAVQARATRHCPAPPFSIDGVFRRALRSASSALGREKVERLIASRPPTASFLKRLRAAFGNGINRKTNS